MQVGRAKRGLVVESLGVSYVLDKLFLFDYSSQVKSSYSSPIIHFALCKEQQHSQKTGLFSSSVQNEHAFTSAFLVCVT
jgi:hypothetical protein